jgi:hypothetical protein
MAFQPDLTRDVFIDFGAFLTEIRSARLTKVPHYQDVVGGELRALSTVAYKSFYFISHRWDSVVDPDPSGWQLEALRQFAVELGVSGRLPSCFWYDFSSLPQGTRTPAEESVFKKGLAGLNALSVGCETIALISGSADPVDDFVQQLKRGWILCEMIVAHRSSQWKWWFHQRDGEIMTAARKRTELFHPIVEDALRSMPVHDEKYLLAWLQKEGVKCTNEADLSYLARRMVEFSYDLHRDKTAVLPQLAKGTVYHLSDEEVARYFIDANGRSPYLQGCTVTYTRRPEGGYDVAVRPDTPPSTP